MAPEDVYVVLFLSQQSTLGVIHITNTAFVRLSASYLQQHLLKVIFFYSPVVVGNVVVGTLGLLSLTGSSIII